MLREVVVSGSQRDTRDARRVEMHARRRSKARSEREKRERAREGEGAAEPRARSSIDEGAISRRRWSVTCDEIHCDPAPTLSRRDFFATIFDDSRPMASTNIHRPTHPTLESGSRMHEPAAAYVVCARAREWNGRRDDCDVSPGTWCVLQ